eukprot:1369178-Heterocapsa_arctica.AAC.1
MGYEWLYNYKRIPDLVEFQEIVNSLENGILNRMMEDEPENIETYMEEADMPNEIKAQGMMTEEMMKKIADIVSASMMP